MLAADFCVYEALVGYSYAKGLPNPLSLQLLFALGPCALCAKQKRGDVGGVSSVPCGQSRAGKSEDF